jgi:hypothetical protein
MVAEWRGDTGTPAHRRSAGLAALVAASTHGPDFRLLFLGALGVSVLSLRLADALVWREAVTRVRAGGKNSRLGVAVGPDLGVTRMVRVPTAVGPALPSEELLKSNKTVTGYKPQSTHGEHNVFGRRAARKLSQKTSNKVKSSQDHKPKQQTSSRISLHL